MWDVTLRAAYRVLIKGGLSCDLSMLNRSNEMELGKSQNFLFKNIKKQ
jgi:hypothetical protein